MELSEETALAVELLRELIKIPSFSKEENLAADFIENYLLKDDFLPQRVANNILLQETQVKEAKYRLLLNSHLDTVKPNKNYTIDPFQPIITDGKLFGLGSNDAGGALVCLLMVFKHFSKNPLRNIELVFLASAEEEISGKNGVELMVPLLGKINGAIIGEPTCNKAAIAQKGLFVADCKVKGIAGHVANDNGHNAINEAIEDLRIIKNLNLDKSSEYLGPTKIQVTQINGGIAHNIIPEELNYVLDIRANEYYSADELFNILNEKLVAEVKFRSTRLQPKATSKSGILLKAINSAGLETYGSPTLSDWALMPFDGVKLGPGDSLRSHTADEFIYIQEIVEGIHTYKNLIEHLDSLLTNNETLDK